MDIDINYITRIIDEEINALKTYLELVSRDDRRDHSRIAAESGRLYQGISSLYKVRTSLLIDAIVKAQSDNHEMPLALD